MILINDGDHFRDVVAIFGPALNLGKSAEFQLAIDNHLIRKFRFETIYLDIVKRQNLNNASAFNRFISSQFQEAYDFIDALLVQRTPPAAAAPGVS